MKQNHLRAAECLCFILSFHLTAYDTMLFACNNFRATRGPRTGRRARSGKSVGERLMGGTILRSCSHYVIQFHEEETTLGGGMSSWNNVTVGGNIHKARLGTLRPATSYKLRLLAVNEVGAGPPSESTLALTLQEGEDNRSDDIFKDSLNTSLSNTVIFFIYTAPSGPPIDISVDATSPESLLVKWKVRVIPNRVQ